MDDIWMYGASNINIIKKFMLEPQKCISYPGENSEWLLKNIPEFKNTNLLVLNVTDNDSGLTAKESSENVHKMIEKSKAKCILIINSLKNTNYLCVKNMITPFRKNGIHFTESEALQISIYISNNSFN
jgi:hypothetical protein